MYLSIALRVCADAQVKCENPMYPAILIEIQYRFVSANRHSVIYQLN